MSYSFSASGDHKEAALSDATQKFDAMVVNQPIHSRDREAALANVRAHLDLIDEAKEGQSIFINMNGSISVYSPTAGAESVVSAGSSCSVSVARSLAA